MKKNYITKYKALQFFYIFLTAANVNFEIEENLGFLSVRSEDNKKCCSLHVCCLSFQMLGLFSTLGRRPRTDK